MSEGGFLIKFNGKEETRCYAIAFDYDKWEYTINNKETRELPENLEAITLEVKGE
ncbi:MAG: hypothetical protein HQ579_07840 [Candidatus Omnitrophica bacterium]|nr:hypothetical protein [Candidatus Omnitrophota bacterium]